jgi:hypothetical protein
MYDSRFQDTFYAPFIHVWLRSDCMTDGMRKARPVGTNQPSPSVAKQHSTPYIRKRSQIDRYLPVSFYVPEIPGK